MDESIFWIEKGPRFLVSNLFKANKQLALSGNWHSLFCLKALPSVLNKGPHWPHLIAANFVSLSATTVGQEAETDTERHAFMAVGTTQRWPFQVAANKNCAMGNSFGCFFNIPQLDVQATKNHFFSCPQWTLVVLTAEEKSQWVSASGRAGNIQHYWSYSTFPFK